MLGTQKSLKNIKKYLEGKAGSSMLSMKVLRYVLAVGFVLAKTVFSGAAIEWTAIDAFIDGHLLGMFALTLALFALILAISWTLSCRIVRKKEA